MGLQLSLIGTPPIVFNLKNPKVNCIASKISIHSYGPERLKSDYNLFAALAMANAAPSMELSEYLVFKVQMTTK